MGELVHHLPSSVDFEGCDNCLARECHGAGCDTSGMRYMLAKAVWSNSEAVSEQLPDRTYLKSLVIMMRQGLTWYCAT